MTCLHPIKYLYCTLDYHKVLYYHKVSVMQQTLIKY